MFIFFISLFCSKLISSRNQTIYDYIIIKKEIFFFFRKI